MSLHSASQRRSPHQPFAYPQSRKVPSAPKATLSWSPVSGVSGYKVAIGTRSQTYDTIIDVAGNTQKIIGNLTDGQIYWWTVFCYDSFGVLSPLADELNFRMPFVNQQWHVTTTGTAGGNGTLLRPWDLQTALNSAIPGDTVYVHAGTYVGAFTVGVSGTPGKWITFKAAPGETVVIRNDAGGSKAILNSGKRYIRIEGFECTTAGTGAAGIFMTGTNIDHCEIVGNFCHGYPGAGSAGIFIDGPSAVPAFGIITNNKCTLNTGGGITISSFAAGYWYIHGNEAAFNDTQGNFDGIQVGVGSNSGHHMIVRRNYCHDNNQPNVSGGDQLDLGGHALSHHYLSEENLIVIGSGHGAYKLHNGGQGGLPAGNWTDGVSGHSISRGNILIGSEMTMYEYPNCLAKYNETQVDGGTFIQHFCNWALTMSLGDSTYATWKTAKGLSDTDTGRLSVKNCLVVQFQNINQYVVFENDNPPALAVIDITYQSVRYRGNFYKMATASKVNWGTLNSANFDGSFATYLASNTPNFPDTGAQKYATTATSGQIFKDYAGGNYSPALGASHIGQNVPLTTTIGSGTNSTSVTCDRADYFMDGYTLGGERLTAPDWIKIGANPPVQIVQVAESGVGDPNVFNVITIATPQTWNSGDEIQLWDPVRGQRRYADPGAIDTQGGLPRPLKPTGLTVTNIVP